MGASLRRPRQINRARLTLNHPRGRRILLALLMGTGLLAHAQESAPTATPPPTKPKYVIEASASRVHGPLWQLQITQEGEASYHYFSGDGRVFNQAQVVIDTDKVQTLLASQVLQALKPLPISSDKRPVPLHMPDFTIKAQTGSERRFVSVYDPASLLPSPELAHFWAAWNAIWALMPQWKLVPGETEDLFPQPRTQPAAP